MTKTVRFGIIILALALCAIASTRFYTYIFDTQSPELTISGIEPDKCYSGDIPCLISVNDQAKVATLSLFIDGKPLLNNYRINRYKAEYPCTIPTVPLPYGAHELRIEATDGAYRKNKTTQSILFNVDNVPLQAAFAKSDTDLKIFQGKTLHIIFQVNKPIKRALCKALGRTVDAVPEDRDSLIYEAFLPISCDDRPNEYPVTLEITDFVSNTILLESKIQVIPFPFTHQTLTLKAEDLEREMLAGASEKEFEDACAQLSEKSPCKKLWQGAFYLPTAVHRISTAFGTVRTSIRGKRPHRAVDIVPPTPKHVVWAPQSGIVVIKGRFAHSGNTIVLDHGAKIFTLYFHLDSFGPYEVGDTVRQGNPLGTVGKTGFASGYHLHWGLLIGNVEVDPLQWTQNDF
jgi:hypothetical protein